MRSAGTLALSSRALACMTVCAKMSPVRILAGPRERDIGSVSSVRERNKIAHGRRILGSMTKIGGRAGRAHSFRIRRKQFAKQSGNFRLVRIADHPRNAMKLRNIFRSALRITTGDDDARSGIGAMNFAHGIARLRISRRGYGTGVEHHDVSRSVLIEHRPSGAAQNATHRRRVCFSGATSEIFKGKCSHEKAANSTQGSCRKNIIAAK